MEQAYEALREFRSEKKRKNFGSPNAPEISLWQDFGASFSSLPRASNLNEDSETSTVFPNHFYVAPKLSTTPTNCPDTTPESSKAPYAREKSLKVVNLDENVSSFESYDDYSGALESIAPDSLIFDMAGKHGPN